MLKFSKKLKKAKNNTKKTVSEARTQDFDGLLQSLELRRGKSLCIEFQREEKE